MAERKPNPDRDAHGLPLCSQDDCACYDGKRCSALGFRPDRFCEPALVEIVEERDALKVRVSEFIRGPGPIEAAIAGWITRASVPVAGPRRDAATTIEQAPPEDLLDRITPEGGCRHTRRSLRPDPHGNPVTTCIDCGDDLS